MKYKKVHDYVGVEKYLLDRYKDKNFRGEWFELNENDIEEINWYIASKTIYE